MLPSEQITARTAGVPNRTGIDITFPQMKAPVSLWMAAILLAPALHAQWPNYPSPGVPKGPDGKPNLSGPAPKAADGHPDLSGLWENVRGNARQVFRATNNRNPDGTLPPEPASQQPPTPGPPLATFGNIGANVKEGLPLKPWAKELLDKRKAENSKDNPDAHCLPMGFMQFHEHPQPRKIIQTPTEVVIIYEANSGLRQIFTDGRPLPNPDDVQPWWYGYSVGHWDGDTLVVETVGFRDDVWLDVNGTPLTNKGTVTEKFRRPDFGHLNIEVTIDDPSAYTKPFTVQVRQQIMLNTDLIEFICGENEQSDKHLVGK